jgi:DNA (cytosine-5)-methyltransferase 1
VLGNGGAAGCRGRERTLTLRLGTYFSGGGGVDWGLRNAGLTPTWAVELEADIAAVYERNFGHSPIVADVRQIDPAELPPVDWFHASPVCTRASVANVGGQESDVDLSTAAAVSRALEVLEPPFFTMENVVQYRDFQSFKNICRTLERLGYFFTTDNVNSADFGVPQTRRRLFVRASRGLLPPLPLPVRWVGWYEAIEDLIPTLPESKLAPWQLARLPAEIKDSLLWSNTRSHDQKGNEYGAVTRGRQEPSVTVTANGGPVNAILVNANQVSRDSTVRTMFEPAATVTGSNASRASHNYALLFAGDSSADSWGDNFREAEQPAFTAKENGVGHQRVLVTEPAEGFLVCGMLNDNGEKLTIRAQADPAFTVTTSHNQRDIKGVLPGGYKVVSITPRALARFQSVPDEYWLPEKRGLAAKVIGNMVPPLLMQCIAEGMLA